MRIFYKKDIFLYVRETPNHEAARLTDKACKDFDIVIGDQNSKLDELKKINIICGELRCISLTEQTTTNQPKIIWLFISKKSLLLTLVTSFVVTVVLFMVDLAMKKDIFDPSI